MYQCINYKYLATINFFNFMDVKCTGHVYSKDMSIKVAMTYCHSLIK